MRTNVNRVMKSIKVQALIMSTIFCLNIGHSYSQTNVKSIDWQKYELESSLKGRISDVLKQIVSDEKFFVEVHVSAKSPSLVVPKYKAKKKRRAQVVNPSKMKTKKDYILFDKLGMNAPMIENESNSQLKLIQYKQKITRDFVAKMDLFPNIESIDIKVGLDKSILEKKRLEIKGIIESILPNVGKIVPTIKLFSFIFHQTAISKAPGTSIWSKLFGPLGIIIASILFCITSFLIFMKYQQMNNELAVKETERSEKRNEDEIESSLPNTDAEVDPQLRPGSSQLAEAINKTDDGVDRYCLYLEKSYEQATNLIKKWINLETRDSIASIYILSERLSIDELYKIFVKLSEEEKETYQKMTTVNLSTAEKQKAEKYIAQQVMEDIISVSIVDDIELQNLLVELTPQKAAIIAIEHNEEGALLINLVGGDFLAKMLEFIDMENTKKLSSLALQVKELDFSGELISLKSIIKDSLTQEYRNPFIRRVAEVMNELDFDRSEALLDTLIDLKEYDAIEDSIKSSFPVRLIERLPGDIIKAVVKPLKVSNKVEIVACFDETDRSTFLDKIAQEGTKGREVIDFELERLLSDESAMILFGDKKSDIYNAFTTMVQKLVKSDMAYRKIAKTVANEWMLEIRDDVSQRKLKIAA